MEEAGDKMEEVGVAPDGDKALCQTLQFGLESEVMGTSLFSKRRM